MHNKKAFTLVELLAVIAIMAMILVVAFPALKAINSTGLATASRQLSSGLSLARQYAITMRTPVRVVLATDLALTNINPSGSNLICSAYNVYYGSNNTALSVVDWWPLQDWRALPSGVVMLNHFANPVSPGNTNYLTGTGATATLVGGPQTAYFDNTNSPMRLITNIVSATTMIYSNASFLEFRPTGAANSLYLPASQVGAIRIVQGALSDARSRAVIVNDAKNWVCIEYDGYMGRVRVRYPESFN